MNKFRFEIDYKAFYQNMLPMLAPIGLLYLIILILPFLHFFTFLLDTILNLTTAIAIPREHMSGILTICLGIFIFATFAFLVFGVPLLITSAFRLVCLPMTITKKGIEAPEGPTLKNPYHTLSWADIIETKRHRFLGLPYIVVSSQKSPPLWIPLFYDKQDLMPETFKTLAPKDNPLRLFFENNHHISPRFDKR